ncbi:dnaJ homolog subfamily C member 15 isoform X5 [Loxodonta africana]|uniref:dnaJ homolog subfamily C member 15 isoform X5 n=1 Tax=Loxodonta africana TaxID=9785 RepID=UPI0030D51E0D
MAARGGVLPAGEGLRYAEYSPPSARQPDADVDRGLTAVPGIISAFQPADRRNGKEVHPHPAFKGFSEVVHTTLLTFCKKFDSCRTGCCSLCVCRSLCISDLETSRTSNHRNCKEDFKSSHLLTRPRLEQPTGES